MCCLLILLVFSILFPEPPHTFTKAIKSDFFHYDKKGVNVTLAQIQKEIVASLNQCAERINAKKLGASLHYVMGKGDWKWRVEYLRPSRYYGRAGSSGNQEGLCPRCFAGKDTWLDVVYEAFNNQRDIEAARRTAVGPSISMHQLSGWHCDMEVPDTLHTIYLGTGRDLVGSLCLQTAECCFRGATWDERLQGLRKSMQLWCVEQGLRPSTIPELRFLP